MLNDAVKKGGAFASSYVGGMSGAFIPVSEDINISEAARVGYLSIEKLEALTSVCSVGLDMVALPGATSAETLAAIIADEISWTSPLVLQIIDYLASKGKIHFIGLGDNFQAGYYFPPWLLRPGQCAGFA